MRSAGLLLARARPELAPRGERARSFCGPLSNTPTLGLSMETQEEGLPPVSLMPTTSKTPQMSAQESCLSLIKYFLFVFNLFFFVLGSLIFCFGIWILIDKTSFVSFVGMSFVPLQIWSMLLAISGVFTMTLALLGCVGALKELRCLLGLYFGMLLLLFATQITLGILISTQRVRLQRKVQDIVLGTIQNYRADPEETAAEESWDYVQFQLRCCGWNSPHDWFGVVLLRGNESDARRVPCSCYNSSATNDSTVLDKIFFPQLGRLGPRPRPKHNADVCVVPANEDYIYREGCAQSLKNWLENNLISLVGICLAVGLLEVSVMVLSLKLQRWAVRREPEPQEADADGLSPGLGLSFMTLAMFLCRNLDHIYPRRRRPARPRPPGPALPKAPSRPFQVP